MSIQGIFYVFIYVSDFERSKKFYGETLGFKIGTDEADVAGFAFGDAYLVIHRDTRPADKIAYGGGTWLAAKVGNVEDEHARLKQAGIEVGEILDQPWGERQFYFDDPDGYHWSFGQAK